MYQLILPFLCLAQNNIGPQYDGNCLTQRIDFTDPSRIFAMDGMDAMTDIPGLDVGRYDMTIDYGTKLVMLKSGGGVDLTIKESPDPALNPDGPRMSTTRFMYYGKISAVVRAPKVPGIVTTFITMGPNLPDAGLDLTGTNTQGGDEVDWEILGFKEFAVRGGIHNMSSDISASHKYTIDWRRDQIIFSIDDIVRRTYLRNGTQAKSSRTPNRQFFPDRPQKIQFAVWSEKTNSWAGGAPQLAKASFDYIDIQCYNDIDLPVAKWPLVNNPDARSTISNQPTRGVNGKIGLTAGSGFNGTIKLDGTSDFNPNSAYGFGDSIWIKITMMLYSLLA